MADKISRRDFLKLTGLVTGVTTVTLAVPGIRKMIFGDIGAENGNGYSVLTVADVLKAAPNYESDILIPNAQAVFGENGRFSPEDHIVIMPTPPVGQSLNVELTGFSNDSATKKKGVSTTFGIQIQRRSETDSSAVIQDAPNNTTEHVARETNSASYFRPLISASTESDTADQNMGGFGLKDSTPGVDGGVYPLLICLVAAPDSILLIAAENFWRNNGVNVDLPSQIKVSYSNLAYPARDEVK